MANDTFIGKWNLYMGGYTADYHVSVETTTATITDEHRADGRLTFETAMGIKGALMPHNASGFSALTGSASAWLPANAIFLILSKDGKTFHGAVKDSMDGRPQVWWGERQ
jgi:hypothetical protein